MVRIITGTLKLGAVAGLAVLTAGVVSPDTTAGKSVACAADGAAACRPSDLQTWMTPEAAGETLAAAREFAAEVTAASGRLYARVAGAAPRETGR